MHINSSMYTVFYSAYFYSYLTYSFSPHSVMIFTNVSRALGEEIGTVEKPCSLLDC